MSTRSQTKRAAWPILLRTLAVMTLLGLTGHWAHAENPNAAAWQSVRAGEAFVMIRHALAPGTGDPPQFRIGDCATQRNLSDEGRAQARRIGLRLKENGISAARVMTSLWCRCRETAELLGLGRVEELPPLNSFFENRQDGPAQTRDLEAWLATQDGNRQPIVLVTHQVNITALTGIVPRSGGIVIARREPTGRIVVLAEL
ncbi:MAG: histidine phosphatase family protein [Hyphomicrobiaceae bacterium]|nr:histidine phosphatase family protein [Hyphomicrobiaceae bacterium]